MRGGRPGTYWRNYTSETWYQRVSTLVHPCHRCLRLHTTIWPAPMGRLHPNCECTDTPVPPGATAPLPVCEPAAVMRSLTNDERVKILGAPVAALVRAGLVPVGETVRDDWSLVPLAALVRLRRLRADQLEAAGVDAKTARAAVAGDGGGR